MVNPMTVALGDVHYILSTTVMFSNNYIQYMYDKKIILMKPSCVDIIMLTACGMPF